MGALSRQNGNITFDGRVLFWEGPVSDLMGLHSPKATKQELCSQLEDLRERLRGGRRRVRVRGHHPSILLAPGARDPILLPSSGMIIGFMSGEEYPAKSCEVAAGARLLIFSDGVFEILRDGEPVWDMEACIPCKTGYARRSPHG